jgi:hypothetical protein
MDYDSQIFVLARWSSCASPSSSDNIYSISETALNNIFPSIDYDDRRQLQCPFAFGDYIAC